MAYAFDRVQKLLNPNQGFGLLGDQQQQETPGLKGQASGDTSQGSGKGGQSTPTSAYIQPSTSAQSRGIISKNKGQVSSPIDTGKLKSSISNAGTSLQNEANAYVASAANPYMEWMSPVYRQDEGSTDTIERYSPSDRLKSGVSDYVSYGSTTPGIEPNYYAPTTDYQRNLSQATVKPDWRDLVNSAPLDPGAFNPTTATDFRGVSDLQAGAGGLRNLFLSSGGARYTPGMAALDSSLMLQSPEFTQDTQEIIKSSGELKKKEGELRAGAGAAAKNVSQNFRDALRGAVTDAALLKENELITQQQNESKQKPSLTDFTTKSDEIKNQLIASNPEWKDYIDSIGDSAFKDLIKKYTKVGNTGSDRWEDYVDPNEASQFNRVQELLNSGRVFVPGDRGFKDSELDTEALKGELKQKQIDFKKPTAVMPGQGSGNGSRGVQTIKVGTPGESQFEVPYEDPGRVTKDDIFDPMFPVIPGLPRVARGIESLQIPEDSLQGKLLKTAQGVAGSGLSPLSTTSGASFPSVQGILSGGGSSTSAGKVDPSMIAGGYINPLTIGESTGGPSYTVGSPKPTKNLSKDEATQLVKRALSRFPMGR